jgi:hypothetical protein
MVAVSPGIAPTNNPAVTPAKMDKMITGSRSIMNVSKSIFTPDFPCCQLHEIASVRRTGAGILLASPTAMKPEQFKCCYFLFLMSSNTSP